MMPKRKSQDSQKQTTFQGFTIVEVTLVTAFVAMLLITVAIIITNISAFFQKGLTLKSVNSVGRNLVEELTSAINAAPSLDTRSLCDKFLTSTNDKCKEEGAYNYIYQEKTAKLKDNITDTEFRGQLYGIFCTGKYSYLWNTHYGLRKHEADRNSALRLRYMNESGATVDYPADDGDPFRIIRIEDGDRIACASRVTVTNYDSISDSNIVNVTKTLADRDNKIKDPVSGFLDNSDDIQLDLYELVLFKPGQDSVTQRALFAGTFILATDLGNINITRSGDYCDLSGQGEKDDGSEDSTNSIFSMGSNFNYCGINKFNFAARTAGSGIIK